MKELRNLRAFGLGLLTLLGVHWTAEAGDFQEIYLVDFEEWPEDTIVSDQYADLGVTFSMESGATDGPIVIYEGLPQRAFGGIGADAPVASGIAGISDPLVGGAFDIGAPIRMDFDPPVTSVRFYVVDIDASDVFVATARSGKTIVDELTISAGDPSTGNGVNTEFLLVGTDITSVVFTPPGGTGIGWALDFLTFTRPCESGTCGPRVFVTQESAPGAGDFDLFPLGQLVAFPWSGSAETFYGYGIPESDSWNGPLSLEADRSHLVLSNTSDALTLSIVHDRAIPDDPDGGAAEVRLTLVDDPDGAVRTVEDDPPPIDSYTGNPGDSEFTAAHEWLQCCSDGFAISGIDCGTLAYVSFEDVDGNPGTPAIEGLTEWVGYSAEGGTIALTLEEGRRVRLQVVPDAACPADLNCDDQVAFGDLLIVLGNWGACTSCLADIDMDGEVAFSDLLVILVEWGPC